MDCLVGYIFYFIWFKERPADPCGHAALGVDLRPLASCDCGFESRRGHGCLSVVSVVCYQVEVCATG